MKRISSLTFYAIALPFLMSCSSAEEEKTEDKKSNQEATEEAPPVDDMEMGSEQEEHDGAVVHSSIEGVYSNGNGAVLTISNFHMNDGLEHMFEFRLAVSGSNSECDGIEYEEHATFWDNSAQEYGSEMVNFRFNEDFTKVSFEPSIEMIGMDCAGTFDTEFERVDF